MCSKRREVVHSISGRTVMNPQRLLPMLLTFIFAVPIHAQVRPQARIDSLLRAASTALDHYQQLAPAISCESGSEKALRDSCKAVLETLGRDVQDAKGKIASYRQLSTPSRSICSTSMKFFTRSWMGLANSAMQKNFMVNAIGGSSPKPTTIS